MAGRLLVREMAAKARASGYDMATVVGHTDRAGPDERNLQDGRARAAAVARILAEQGFAGSAVRVETAGESQPIRVHEDERREPLNRRAVVVFSSTH
jgi:outer membrane protein OmpA-like peptidoglycan-associated protein